MKFSEAVRLGAVLGPQAFGDLYVRDSTCALGGAFKAAGFVPGPPVADGIPIRGRGRVATQSIGVPNDWFLILTARRVCPVCTSLTGLVSEVIAHLNDHHRWTRERIADFVQSIEDQQPAPKSRAAEVAGEARELAEVGHEW